MNLFRQGREEPEDMNDVITTTLTCIDRVQLWLDVVVQVGWAQCVDRCCSNPYNQLC